MEKIQVKDKIIEYTLERKKIKNCYISVKNTNVMVRVPMRTSQEKIEKIILERADWILKNIEKQKKNAQAPKNYMDGEIFKVLGKEVILKISYDKIKKPKLKFWLNRLNITLPIENEKQDQKKQIQKMIEQFYQELAEKEVEKAMQKMMNKVGIAPNQYQVKKLKSTWGNCSSSRNISINRDVVMYSRQAIEYVCLHEICHLQNMNHSSQFWSMVAEYMPDFEKAEKELKN